MDTKARRKKVIEILQRNENPVSASTLAEEFSVSRQVIVGDVALLRAENNDIRSTARGYILNKDSTFPFTGKIPAKHDKSAMEDELNTIVDFGGTCIDVEIDHDIYGTLTGKLDISSRYDVKCFIESMAEESRPLSVLSGGIHMHTIGCPSEEIFHLICSELDKLGILYHG